MKIKYLIFIFMLISVILISGIFSYLVYVQKKSMLIKGVNQKLYLAANMAKISLPADYHDKIVDAFSVTPENFDNITARYDQLCMDADLECLWSIMMIDGKIVFTSTTSPDKIINKQNTIKFFTVHPTPELYGEILLKQKTEYKYIYNNSKKKYAALIPFHDSHGRPYLFGAGINKANFDALFGQIMDESIVLGVLFLGAGLISSYVMAKIFSKPFTDLSFETAKLVSGESDEKIEEKGCYEYVSIAQNINRISMGIKKKLSALAKDEKRYKAVMESLGDLVFENSKDLVIEYMNPNMIQWIGYDATGEYCFKAVHGFDEKCPWCCNDEVINGEKIDEVDILSPKDNCSYQIFSSPIVNNDGSVSSLNILRDVTQIQQLESLLRQSQKMEAIGTLAGGIAHDFNNLLFPILGFAGMLLDDVSEDSPFYDSVQGIYNGALRASELVKQILTFSRQETNLLGQMRLQPIVKEALKLLRSSIPATIEIQTNLSPDCGMIQADPTQIHQIIMNLATNAYHAMEKTGGRLNVGLKEVELDGHNIIPPDTSLEKYVCLTVSDTGTGMDKDLIPKIFDPFFTTKEEGKGTGMGLFAVNEIVKCMGGSIQVDSEPGKGSEFRIYFPLEKCMLKKEEFQVDEIIQTGMERIMIVDDEEIVIATEKKMLDRLGYHVTAFVSSIDALEVFRADPDKFDLVITDLAMPNMSGDKLAVELIKIRSDIPVLLCTGFSETVLDSDLISCGIKEVLLKPVVMKIFAQKIREVLKNVNK